MSREAEQRNLYSYQRLLQQAIEGTKGHWLRTIKIFATRHQRRNGGQVWIFGRTELRVSMEDECGFGILIGVGKGVAWLV